MSINNLLNSMQSFDPAGSYAKGQQIRANNDERKAQQAEQKRKDEDRIKQQKQQLRESLANNAYAVRSEQDPQRKKAMVQRFMAGVPPEFQGSFSSGNFDLDADMFLGSMAKFEDAQKHGRAKELNTQKHGYDKDLEGVKQGNRQELEGLKNQYGLDKEKMQHGNTKELDADKHRNAMELQGLKNKGGEGKNAAGGVQLKGSDEKRILDTIAGMIPQGIMKMDANGNVVEYSPQVLKAARDAVALVQSGQAPSQMVAIKAALNKNNIDGYVNQPPPNTGPQLPGNKNTQEAPPAAVQYLQSNPQFAEAFKAKYGYLP